MIQNQLRLVDGTIVKLCPTVKPLYCSRAGKFYSLHNAILTEEGWVLREIKTNLSPAMQHNPNTHGGVYPSIRQSNGQPCHKLVALTWIGPRPIVVTPDGQAIQMQIDHLNGDKHDWRADNLEYVTPAENRKRAKLLRILHSIGRDPRLMSRSELLSIFRRYDFMSPADRMEYEMTHHMEF